MVQELYGLLREHALSSESPELNLSLVGKYVMVYEPLGGGGAEQPEPRPQEAYSPDGTIIVGKVSDVRFMSQKMIRHMEDTNRRARDKGNPSVYLSHTSTQSRVIFKNDEVLAVTPENSEIINGYFHGANCKRELTSPRVLDDDELVSKVESLMEELTSKASI